jgi:hypothetical protein
VVQRTNVKFKRVIPVAGVFVECHDKKYKNESKKKDAWQEISFHVGTYVGIVEKKMKSLLAQYRRERRRVADVKKQLIREHPAAVL